MWAIFGTFPVNDQFDRISDIEVVKAVIYHRVAMEIYQSPVGSRNVAAIFLWLEALNSSLKRAQAFLGAAAVLLFLFTKLAFHRVERIPNRDVNVLMCVHIARLTTDCKCTHR